MNLLIPFILIPFLNPLIFQIRKEEGEINQNFSYISSKLLAIISIVLLFGLMRKTHQSLSFLNFNSDISLLFEINKENIRYILLNLFLWLILLFYSKSFLSFSDQKISENEPDFIKILPIFVGFVNLIILSKNLSTLVFSYSALAIYASLIFNKYLIINNNKNSKIFLLFIFIEITSLLMFFFISSNFVPDLSFSSKISQINASNFVTLVIFTLFFLSFFLTIFIPSYILIHNNLDYNSFIHYLIFPLFLGFSKLLIFTKIIIKTISIGLFSTFISKYYILAIEIIFSLSILFSLFHILFSRDFKRIFFYLFFNQTNLTFLFIFITIISDQENSLIIISNYILLITLSFLVISNLILYLKNAENKDFDGIFYNLRITIILLIFVFLNFSSLFYPNFIENLSILEISLKNRFFISILTIILNSIGIFLFIYKLAFPTFKQEGVEYYETDIELAKKIDFSSKLSLTAILISVIIILGNIYN